jgi:hypothetical protein
MCGWLAGDVANPRGTLTYFFDAWWIGVFAGVFEKTWCFEVVICGEFVVKCVVIAGGLTVTFGA